MAGLKFLPMLRVYENKAYDLVEGGNQNDREVAGDILKAMQELQDALDAAALSGLVVEPSFSRISNRFQDRGTDAESFVAKIKIYRKLT